MTGRWYLVESPEYDYVEPVLDDGSGPVYATVDTLYVKARNARRAKVLFLRTMRREFKGKWKRPLWLDDGLPFKGMRASLVNIGPEEVEDDAQ